VVEWLANLHSNGLYPHGGVSSSDEDDAVFTYAEWADMIKVCGSCDHLIVICLCLWKAFSVKFLNEHTQSWDDALIYCCIMIQNRKYIDT